MIPVPKPDAAEILASMAVTGEEKLTFDLRLMLNDGELTRVMRDVTGNGATYIVARTNTIVNSRRPLGFFFVANLSAHQARRQRCPYYRCYPSNPNARHCCGPYQTGRALQAVCGSALTGSAFA